MPTLRFRWRWLDRLWLTLIALAFLFMAPIWIALWWERHWALGLIQVVFIVGLLWRAAQASTPKSSPTH